MSPKSRGRKPKKLRGGRGRSQRLRQVPEDPVAELVRTLGDALEDAVDGADPLGAEATAASALGQMRQEAGADWDLEPLAELIDRCVGYRTSQALAVVLALSEVLPDSELRARASDAAERLSSHVERPPWAAGLGQARLVGCWQMTDVFGDQANVLCSFDREGEGGEHGLMFLLDANGPGAWIKDLFVVDDVDEALEQMRSAAAESEITRLVQLGPEEVRVLLLPPLMASVESDPDDFYDQPSEEVHTLWPLAMARLRDLPEALDASTPLPADDIESLVAEFLDSEEARDTGFDNASLRHWAGHIARYGNERDAGRPLRVGPGKTLVLALESDVEDEETEPLAQVLLAWNEWAGRREGLPEEAVEALLFAVEMMLDEAFAVLEGDEDLKEDEELQQLSIARHGSAESKRADSKGADAEARRRFAVPHRDIVLDGERYTDLDPDDPDELGLLVIGEHPEYQHVLDDPSSEELVEDVNPRLYIALLTVVITRLWTGEPASTWREAKKMLAAGAERQEILDALTVPVAEEIQAALSPELGLAAAMGKARHTGTSRGRGQGEAPGEGAPTALQVRVDIAGARPPIWRRLVLPATMSLDELHLALQLAFGWTDSHLHAFRRGRQRFGQPDGMDDTEDESAIRVGELLTGAGDRLEYEYDFGDSWLHQIVVEDTVADGGVVRCLGGRRAGPPEDCGGVFFYNDLAQAWGQPEHPAHGEAAELLEANPASFDRVTIDDRLRRVPVS